MLDQINTIDEKLEVLLEKMDYDDYVSFIKTNKQLKNYDNLMAYIDLKLMPESIQNSFTKEFLDEVESLIDKKITEC